MRALVVLALAAAIANAASITWTGIADDNQWFNHINWSPAQVPGPNDDVSIPSGYVQVTAPTGCNSLSMGTLVEAPANLTLYQAFSIGSSQGLVVESNGNLVINTGLSMVFGQVTIGGTLNFIDGVLGGAWTVLDRAAANLGNGNEKGFSACTFQSKGALSLGGVIQLNQSSVFQIMTPVSVNTQLIIQQDDNSTGVLFDASTTSFTFSTSTLTIQAPVSFGSFTLQSGNITILNSLSFNQMFDIPAGSYVTALGTAQFNASAGISGAGVVSIALAASQSATIGKVTMTGAFNVVGGDTLFSVASSIGVLSVNGGNAVFMADVMAQQLNLLNGQTAGNGIVTGMNVLVSSRGFSLGSAVVANTSAMFQASILAFGPTAAFKVADGAKATVTGALLLTGPPNTPGMTNNGQIDAQAAVSSQNIDIKGAGSVSVATTFKVGTLTFTQKAVTLAGGASFSGSNTFLTVGKIASATGGSVSAVIGDYTFTCPAQCDNMNTPNSNPPTSNFAFSA